ncbi:MAG: helix-turn-helix transcriptional regulator [Ruminococcus sp.]|nr:helix-turn-helix transcriptional regulator [Ruminococcus sp.]
MYTYKVKKRLWLYKLRTDKNLTQGEIACAMGISRSHYASIELGRRGLHGSLQRDYFVTISECFGIPLETVHEMEQEHLDEVL